MVNKVLLVVIIVCILAGAIMLLSNNSPTCENSCNSECYGNCTEGLNFVCRDNVGMCSYLSANDTIKVYNQPLIETKLNTIYVTRDIMNKIDNAYLISKSEIYYCLNGEKYKDSFIINDVYTPPLNTSSEVSIMPLYACLPNSFGYVHSHPNGICMPSNESNNQLDEDTGGDINAWIKDDNAIYGIMCGNDKINFYNRDQYSYDAFMKTIVVDNGTEKDITLTVGPDLCSKSDYYCGGNCFSMNSTETHTCVNNQMTCIRLCNDKCYRPCDEGVFKCRNGKGICLI